MTWYRTLWLLPAAALYGVGERIGWTGRLWSSITPTADTPFLIQISTTIIAPTPPLAPNFIILSRLVQQLSTSYSRRSAYFLSAFINLCKFCDVGGGIASNADDLAGANVGANVMFDGIIFQFVVYSTLGCDFVQRYLRNRPARTSDSSRRGPLTPRLKLMLAALAFSTPANIVLKQLRNKEAGDDSIEASMDPTT
ncbi:hypothetical protein FB451DRAFT_1453412 [Mycena latifolia]|nr:hypothetical protein FB451DRAFT_1453412 [Mycena latifolia]